METIAASMAAIKDPQSGVKHALTTIWGDEGNECDMCVFHIIHRKKEKIKFMKSILPPPFSCSSWSALPGILFYSEHAYSPHKAKIDDEFLKTKFLAICGGSLEDFVLASKLDDLQDENQFVDDKASVPSPWPIYSLFLPLPLILHFCFCLGGLPLTLVNGWFGKVMRSSLWLPGNKKWNSGSRELICKYVFY